MDLVSILKSCGHDIWDEKIKMVRHADKQWDLRMLLRTGHFDRYESHQSSPIFHGCDYLLSFLGERGTRSRFLGCRRVTDCFDSPKPLPPDFPYPEMAVGPYSYDLQPVPGFESLQDRLIVDWGRGRMWHQWLRSKRVIEILPDGHVGDFPGYDDVLLTYAELRRVVENADANRSWHLALRAVAGVYLIVDARTGDQYVGSASGASGILGRWRTYARSGHGNNKLLEALHESDPDRVGDLQFSILRTLPLSMTQTEVTAVETVYKKKLGTRAHGLNAN